PRTRAVSQPGQDTLAGAIAGRGAGAEVAHPFGLNTGPEDRRACRRVQAVRAEILRFCNVTKRHIVLSEMYTTTGSAACHRAARRRLPETGPYGCSFGLSQA